MNIKSLTNEELLAELNRREESKEEAKTADVMVFGTTCINEKEDAIEMFKKIEKADDLPNMFSYGMRAMLNSHRSYRTFYFKVSSDSFDLLKRQLEEDPQSVAKLICESPNVKFKDL